MMAPLRTTAEALLERLFSQFDLDTARWTYARTAELRAVAAPHPRDDASYDVVVYVQPNRPFAGAMIAGCQVQLGRAGAGRATVLPPPRASFDLGGRLVFEGLAPGRYQAFLPTTLVGLLREAALHWQETCRSDRALAAAPRATADREIWEWRSQDGRLRGHAVLEIGGDLVFRFRSTDLSHEGVRILIRAGDVRVPSVLTRCSDAELLAEATLPRGAGLADAFAVLFEVAEA